MCDGVCDANSASRLLIIVCSRSQNSEVSLESCVALHVTPPSPPIRQASPHTLSTCSAVNMYGCMIARTPHPFKEIGPSGLPAKILQGNTTGSIVLNSSLLGRGLAPTQSRSGSKLPEVLSSVVAG